jgi:hypothetical protein
MSEQLEELTQAYDAAVRAGDQPAIDDLAIQIDQKTSVEEKMA